MPPKRLHSPIHARQRNKLRRHPYGRIGTGDTQTIASSKDIYSFRPKKWPWSPAEGKSLDAKKKAANRNLMGWGYRPDLTRVSDRSAFEYGGTMYYDEVDRTLFKVRERKARRLAGLPAGAHIDIIPLRELIRNKGKEPVSIGTARLNEEGEDELALLRYD